MPISDKIVFAYPSRIIVSEINTDWYGGYTGANN